MLRTCYSGFGRGLLTELINLAGVVSVTAVAINVWHPLAEWLRPWIWFDPAYGSAVAFWLLFLIMVFLLRVAMGRLSELIRWERLHWTIQGLGLVIGGLRGLWWAGLLVILLTSSGFVYLRESVESRSVLGPRLHQVARRSIGLVVSRFPGSHLRGQTLVPALKPTGRGAPSPSRPARPTRGEAPW